LLQQFNTCSDYTVIIIPCGLFVIPVFTAQGPIITIMNSEIAD